MANHHTPVEVDPQAVKHAKDLWNNFTVLTKYSVIASAVILLLMGFFLL
jgi:hypothetical protein